MGIFSFFSNAEKKKTANIDLAESLLAAGSLPAGEKTNNKKIDKILKQCTTRQSVLDKVIELCGEPETPRQRYIIAAACMRSKSENRENAIKAIELYLANLPYEEIFKNEHRFWGSKAFSPEEEKKIHLADMYAHLGKEYESIYSFNKALSCYKKESDLTPFYPAPYCRTSSVHVKKNQLTEAMNVLLSAKKTRYYKPITYKTPAGDIVTEDTFKTMIDSHIQDLEKKIEKGYVYVLKKRK